MSSAPFPSPPPKRKVAEMSLKAAISSAHLPQSQCAAKATPTRDSIHF